MSVSAAIRTSVLQQLWQQISDEEIELLAQVLNAGTQRRTNQDRAEHEAKRQEGRLGMERTPTERTRPSPPSSTQTVLSDVNLSTRTTIPIANIDDNSEQSTQTIIHPTEHEIDNESDFLVPPPHSQQIMPPAETDYLPLPQRSCHLNVS